MKKTTERLRRHLLVIALLLIAEGLCMAVDVSWIGEIYPAGGIDVEHISGTIVLIADIQNINVTGLPEDEYSNQPDQYEYKWYVNNVLLTDEHSSTLTLADQQNEINGWGVYNIRCEARCHFPAQGQSSVNGLWSDWKLAGEHSATFFILEYQRPDGVVVTSAKVTKNGSEKLNAIIKPSIVPEIELTKIGPGIEAYYDIPGIVTISGCELGIHNLYAEFRERTIYTLPVSILEAYVQITIEP